MLLGSGLIAGEGIMGVLIAAYAIWATKAPAGLPFGFTGLTGEIISFAVFCALGLYIFRMAKKTQ